MTLLEDLFPVTKANSCHVSSGSKGGQFCGTDGAGSDIKIKPAKQKAWDGEVTELKNKTSKLETGKLGEDLVTAYLKGQGHADARTLNVKVNNFPVDLVQNHHAIEVKTGLVSNGSTAQHWRATIGQPGKEESKWLAKASKEEKSAWNKEKGEAILARKQAALEGLSKQFGRPVKGKTMALIINPDTRKADIYRFDGFHLRIPWNSPQAKAGYIGTVSY